MRIMPGTVPPVVPGTSRRSLLIGIGVMIAVLQLLPSVASGVMPRAQRARLDNGMVVLFRPNPAAQTVGVTISVDLPATFENARTAGIRSLLARLLQLRPIDDDGRSPREQLAEMGAVTDSRVLRDCIVVSLVGLGDDFADYLVPLKQMVFGPEFDWAALPAARAGQSHMQLALQGTSDTWAAQLADAYMFRGTAYAWPVEGTSASLQAMGQRELQQLHQGCFRPNNCVMAVCGPLEPEETIRAIVSVFGSVLPGPEPRRDPVAVPDREPIYIHRPWSGPGATVMLSLRGPSVHSADFAALQVLWAVLAGGEGARLWASLREETGLVYRIGTDLDAGADLSIFRIVVQCDTETAAGVYARVWEQLHNIQEAGPSARETHRAIRYIEGNRLITEQSNLYAAETLGVHELLARGGGPELQERLDQSVAAVTSEDVRMAASRYLRRPIWVQLGGVPPQMHGGAPKQRSRLAEGRAGYSSIVLPGVVEPEQLRRTFHTETGRNR